MGEGENERLGDWEKGRESVLLSLLHGKKLNNQKSHKVYL
jgi:hypothetical protein